MLYRLQGAALDKDRFVAKHYILVYLGLVDGDLPVWVKRRATSLSFILGLSISKKKMEAIDRAVL